MARYRTLRLVRTGYLKTQIVQHFGNPAHARTADAHKMNMIDSIFHVVVIPEFPYRFSDGLYRFYPPLGRTCYGLRVKGYHFNGLRPDKLWF